MSLIERLRDMENEGITHSDRFHLRQEAATVLESAEAILFELGAEAACHCHEGFTSRNMHEPNTICHLRSDIESSLTLIRGDKP